MSCPKHPHQLGLCAFCDNGQGQSVFFFVPPRFIASSDVFCYWLQSDRRSKGGVSPPFWKKNITSFYGCISSYRQCPWNFAPSAVHLMVSLFLCSSRRSNALEVRYRALHGSDTKTEGVACCLMRILFPLQRVTDLLPGGHGDFFCPPRLATSLHPKACPNIL